ncbi:MAG: recombination protein O N-terminal domain-containing protein [Lentisphaeria bacterium]|nr:recombination protein O N-terminal domain-containing protein [Lentisphaeria bacterium]
MERTTVIILRKTPFREADIMATAVSPDWGKLELVCYGAQSVSGKKFPVMDCYNELEIGFEPAVQGPSKLQDAELLTSFAPVADKLEIFKLCGKIGAFVLKNSAPDLPMAIVYDTLRHVLGNLALNASGGNALWTPEACGAVIKLAVLQENGLFPEFDDPKISSFFDNIIEAGLEGAPLPQCAPEYWGRLTLYLNTLFPAESK